MKFFYTDNKIPTYSVVQYVVRQFECLTPENVWCGCECAQTVVVISVQYYSKLHQLGYKFVNKCITKKTGMVYCQVAGQLRCITRYTKVYKNCLRSDKHVIRNCTTSVWHRYTILICKQHKESATGDKFLANWMTIHNPRY